MEIKTLHTRLNELANDLETISWDMEKNKDFELMEIIKLIESIIWSLMNTQTSWSKESDHYSIIIRRNLLHNAKLLFNECKKFKVNDRYNHIESEQ